MHQGFPPFSRKVRIAGYGGVAVRLVIVRRSRGRTNEGTRAKTLNLVDNRVATSTARLGRGGLSEIERAPSAVLPRHDPDTPPHGDVASIKRRVIASIDDTRAVRSVRVRSARFPFASTETTCTVGAGVAKAVLALTMSSRVIQPPFLG